MIYVEKIHLPSEDDNQINVVETYHKSFYPFHVLSSRGLYEVEFSDITLITGGNGTGKSTLLNVIAQKLNLHRQTPFNRTVHFDMYLRRCSIEYSDISMQLPYDIREYGRIITSDEVFDYMLDLRIKNEKIDEKRRIMLEEINRANNTKYQDGPRNIDFEDQGSVETYTKFVEMKQTSTSHYIKNHLGFNILEQSNGENAFKYFTDAMKPQGLYLLDEPENSLSAERQIALAEYIESVARFEQCQFIISTHSPFLMSIRGAKLYNLDVFPAAVMPWSEVSEVKVYHDFFKKRDSEFNNQPDLTRPIQH